MTKTKKPIGKIIIGIIGVLLIVFQVMAIIGGIHQGSFLQSEILTTNYFTIAEKVLYLAVYFWTGIVGTICITISSRKGKKENAE